jgi:hypothetical protein
MVFVVKIGHEELRYNDWFSVVNMLQPLFEHGLKKVGISQEA